MELFDRSLTSQNIVGGSSVFDASAGQSVKIETSPSGLDVFSEEVPEGERWEIAVNVRIKKFSV